MTEKPPRRLGSCTLVESRTLPFTVKGLSDPPAKIHAQQVGGQLLVSPELLQVMKDLYGTPAADSKTTAMRDNFSALYGKPRC